MNLLTNGAAFDRWIYPAPPSAGSYTVIKDQYIDAKGIGNLGDLVIAGPGSYAGLYQDVVLQPNTQYYFHVWAFSPITKFGRISFQINQSTFTSPNNNYFWDPNNTSGLVTTQGYKTLPTTTSGNLTPWIKYSWSFVSPAETDPTKTVRIFIKPTASPQNDPTYNQIAFWGAYLGTSDTEEYEYGPEEVYPINTSSKQSVVRLLSVDELDTNNEFVTQPFDPLRYGFTDYNLIRFNRGHQLDLWSFSKPNFSLPSPGGYSVTKDATLNPTGTSNYADKVTGYAGAFGGLETDVFINPNTDYTFSVYAYTQTSGQVALRYWTPQTGSRWWTGSNTNVGDFNYGVYVYPPVTDGTSRPWTRYIWKFSTGNNIVPGTTLPNAKISIVPTANSNIFFYGAQLVKGHSALIYEEPVFSEYSVNGTPKALELYPPSIDLYDVDNIALITTPFDEFRYSVFTALGKTAIPYGNTFDILEPDGSSYKYTIGSRSGISILGNRIEAPVDPVNNAIGSGFIADLFEGSTDPAVLATDPGISFTWNMNVSLIEGNPYVISLWVKPRFLNLSARISTITPGNWFLGIEDIDTVSNFAHPAWKTFNGSYVIEETNLSGRVNGSMANSVGELGYPDFVPADKRLYSRNAERIRLTSLNAATTFYALTDYNPGSGLRTRDLSTATNLTDLETKIKRSVFVYQEYPYDLTNRSYGVDAWSKVGREYAVPGPNNTIAHEYDPLVQGMVNAAGLMYTDTAGRKIYKVYRNFNSLFDQFYLNRFYVNNDSVGKIIFELGQETRTVSTIDSSNQILLGNVLYLEINDRLQFTGFAEGETTQNGLTKDQVYYIKAISGNNITLYTNTSTKEVIVLTAGDISNLTLNILDQNSRVDTTKPVGIGMFLEGVLSNYGFMRVWKDVNPGMTNFTSLSTSNWTRMSFAFTATRGMADRTQGTYRPGSSVPFTATPGSIKLNFIFNQPAQPKDGNGVPLPGFEVMSPYHASVYTYGLMINDGTVPTEYIPDPIIPQSYPMFSIPSNKRAFNCTVEYIGDFDLKIGGIRRRDDQVKSHIGMNACSNETYSYAHIFLNIMKLSGGGLSRIANNIDDCWPQVEKLKGACFLTRPANHPDGNGVDGAFNTFGRWETFLNVSFSTGGTVMTFPDYGSGAWWNLFVGDFHSKRVTGPNVAPGTKFTSIVRDDVAKITTVTVDTPFIGDSDLESYYYFHREVYTSPRQLNLDENGYPRFIPSGGYKLSWMAMRVTPPWIQDAGMMNNPFMPSGRYVLKWDGEGDITMNASVGLNPGAYPATEISRTSNRIVYNIDCSGNTPTGLPVRVKKSMRGDDNAVLLTQSRTGFMVTISSTNPENHIRNIRLCEERYESQMDSGEIFYESWLDRLKIFKTIRCMDWMSANTFQFYAGGVEDIPPYNEVSWVSNRHIPYEVIIEQANRLHRDLWLNLPPQCTDEYYLHVAKLFKDNLNPELRLYIEWGNEQWNGGLGTGIYLRKYQTKYNFYAPASSVNPGWEGLQELYALKSQHVFDIWDSVFSGDAGKLHPVRLWDNPKTQPRRLIRVLSSFNDSISANIWQFGVKYTKNPLKIPYDSITTNAYYADFLDSNFKTKDKSLTPNPYPWTLEEMIPYILPSLVARDAETTLHYNRMLNLPEVGQPNGRLGLDADGDPYNPGFSIYEGGFGCPGPSQYTLYNILRMIWEEDGNLKTLYTTQRQQIETWEALINNHPRKDECVYILWKTPQNYGASDQWAVTDKSMYTEAEYYSFPRSRLYSEVSGIRNLPTVGPVTVQTSISKPTVRIDNAWEPTSNVKAKENNEWKLKPSYIIQYKKDGNWN